MNQYTKEDVLALNYMVDDTVLKKINFTIVAWRDDDNDTLRICNPNDVTESTIEHMLKKIIITLRSKLEADIEEFNKLIFDEPLEKVPLYINKPNNLRLLARWRLLIGK